MLTMFLQMSSAVQSRNFHRPVVFEISWTEYHSSRGPSKMHSLNLPFARGSYRLGNASDVPTCSILGWVIDGQSLIQCKHKTILYC